MSRPVYGLKPVLEALRAEGGRVAELLILEGGRPSRLGEVLALARAAGVKVKKVRRAELDRLAAGANHQGVVALVGEFVYTDLDRLIEDPAARLLVMLDGLQDPHNLGAIARSALAAGADGLVIPKNRAVQVTPAAVKVSAGALAHLPVCRATNLNQTARDLKEAGFWLMGASPEAEVSLFAAPNPPDKLVVVIGAEGKGVSRKLKEKCDFLVSLPLAGSVESLNASAAAAVILFELKRRRGEG